MALLISRMVRLLSAGLLLIAAVPTGGPQAAPGAPAELLILCYHSIQPTASSDDPYTLTQQRFVEQLEYLQTHGYRPVSFEAVAAAAVGTSALPDKAVLLTFDDGYRSYHDFVAPLLDLYGFPSVLAVVGSWIENKAPPGLSEPLMNWAQIRALDAKPNIAVVSHSFDLHKSAQYTPQGNVGAVVGVRAFNPADGTRESEAAYINKLRHDFARQDDLFRKRLGRPPRAIVWPYGEYNAIGMRVAAESGMDLGFCLDEKDLGRTRLKWPGHLNRMLIVNEPIDRFIYALSHLDDGPAPLRAAQVDLDLIYDADSDEQTDRNLGLLIERLVALRVNTVFLQAFADPEGSGNIRSVYFHNRVLPVRADIFGHAVHQISIRGIEVFAWMPTLSIVFADDAFNQRYRVREHKNGRTVPSGSWYQRLTPFSAEVAGRVRMLYEDVAAGALISGVLFQDDAYLNDFEDFHPLALQGFGARTGRTITPAMISDDDDLGRDWMQFKTERLNTFIDGLAEAVRIYRPYAFFARNLYAPMIAEPEAEQWFAQNYDLFLKHYDYVVVMAYAQMEKARRPVAWLKALAAAADRPQMKAKTVFKLQTYDWQRNRWVPDRLLLDEMRAVLAAGIRHLAYYPDNLWEQKPDQASIIQEMSTRSLPGE